MFRRFFLILGLASVACAQGVGPLYTLSTIAGNGQDARLVFRPETLALDASGSLYIGDYNGKVLRVSPSGAMVTIAGPDVPGTDQLGSPLGVAVDAAKSVYIADTAHNQVLKLTAAGAVTTFAGTGAAGGTGDGGPAVAAEINQPYALAADRLGNVYIGEYGGGRVRKVAPNGTILTVAGNGQFGTVGDGGPATAAQIAVMGLAVDASGNLYIADGVTLVRKVGPDGIIHTFAGGGSHFDPQDGVPATAAELLLPDSVSVDATGSVYIAEGGKHDVRKVTSDGIIHTVAGTGTAGYLLDPNRDARLSQLSYPTGIVADAAGNFYIADFWNSVVRRVDAQGKISLFASAPIGDGGPASSALLAAPTAVALDAHGAIYINDGSGRIRKIDSAGNISTVAGTGEQGFVADGVPATAAPLNNPQAIAVSPAGELFIADTGNQRVRKVGSDGIINTVAGSGTAGFSGDDGPAVSAQLSSPSGVAVDAAGNLYISDTGNHRVRKVTPSGAITTVAGKGTAGWSGDSGPATAAELSSPAGLAIDSAGNLYVADPDTGTVRKVWADGIISTAAGTGQFVSSTIGGPYDPAAITRPVAVALDSDGGLFIADIADQRIRRVRAGAIDTVAGWGVIRLPGSATPPSAPPGELPAFLEPVSLPAGVTIDSGGNLYFTEYGGRLLLGTVHRSSGFGLPQLFPQAVVNAANLFPAPVAPGELVTLFGTDLGPAAAIGAQPDASGKFGTNLAGVRVLFDGVPAPVLYAQSYQVEAIVPFSVTPGTVQVEVSYNRTPSAATSVAVTEAAPAVFTVVSPSPLGGQAAALNQDGTPNSPDNPAAVGSVLTLFATGAGLMQPPASDGQVAASAGAAPALPVFATVNYTRAPVLYAGPAPGLVAGVFQVNIQVPYAFSCLTSPNASQVILSAGQPDDSASFFGKYFSLVAATIAVKGDWGGGCP